MHSVPSRLAAIVGPPLAYLVVADTWLAPRRHQTRRLPNLVVSAAGLGGPARLIPQADVRPAWQRLERPVPVVLLEDFEGSRRAARSSSAKSVKAIF